jgi:hypothetical protein
MFGRLNAPNGPRLTSRRPTSGASFRGDGDLGGFGDARGLVPRCLDYIFAHFQQRVKARGSAFVCSAQFLEVYQEQVHDLLEPACPALKVRESLEKGVWAEGACEENIADAAAAELLLARGEAHRHTAATAMNHVSSRSHAVFTLKVTAQQAEGDDGGFQTLVAKFNLVDLAGSERQADTLTEGSRLKEASGINKSLSNLGLVIQALVDRAHGKPRHVHYRDAKITFLLRDSLNGNSTTTMLCCVSPSEPNFGETLSCLRFAQRAKEIPTHAEVNSEYTLADMHKLKAAMKALQAENSALKAALAPSNSRHSRSSFSRRSVEGPSAGEDALPRMGRHAERRADAELLSNEMGRADAGGAPQALLSAMDDGDEAFRDSALAPPWASTPLAALAAVAQRLAADEAAADGDDAERRAPLGADLRAAVAVAQTAAAASAARQAQLEGLVNRLEVEKAATEDECDLLEARCRALSDDCADLTSQATFARAKQREAEAEAKAAAKAAAKNDPAEALKQRIEVPLWCLRGSDPLSAHSPHTPFRASCQKLESDLSRALKSARVSEAKAAVAKKEANSAAAVKTELETAVTEARSRKFRPPSPSTGSVQVLRLQPGAGLLGPSVPDSPRPAPVTSVTPRPAPDTSVTPRPAPDTSVTPRPAPDTSVTPRPASGTSVTPRPATTPKCPLDARLGTAQLGGLGDAEDHRRPSLASSESAATTVASSAPSASPRNPLNRPYRPPSSEARATQPALPLPSESPVPRAVLASAANAASSKSNQIAQRERRKASEAAQRAADATAREAAAARTGASLSGLEVTELRGLGFYAAKGEMALPDGLGEGLLARRKAAVRGVRVKELTADGKEAALSQTLAYWRMQSVHDAMASLFHQAPAPLALSDVCATLRRIETRLERGHALLAFLASLHR